MSWIDWIKIVSVEEGSMAEELGWRVGDTLQGINGERVREMERLFDIADKAASDGESEVEIELSRGDEKITTRIRPLDWGVGVINQSMHVFRRESAVNAKRVFSSIPDDQEAHPTKRTNLNHWFTQVFKRIIRVFSQ